MQDLDVWASFQDFILGSIRDLLANPIPFNLAEYYFFNFIRSEQLNPRVYKGVNLIPIRKMKLFFIAILLINTLSAFALF